jgi:hypothetical protein
MNGEKKQCSARVWHNGGVWKHPCQRYGVIEENGDWWCKQHAPSIVKASDDARQDKWTREWAERDAKLAAEAAAEAKFEKDAAYGVRARELMVKVRQFFESIDANGKEAWVVANAIILLAKIDALEEM